jgi:hypothetical protein
MNRATLFDVIRDVKGTPLKQHEVDRINAVLDGAAAPAQPVSSAKTLRDPAAFFATARAGLGGLSQEQVDGFNRLLKAMGEAAWPVSYAAYGLATAWWETANSMRPVEEGYYLGPAKAKAHQRGLRYYPHYGRGDVQLTWPANYERADKELGLGGKLVANPDLALDPVISSKVLAKGMEQGWFTGKKLSGNLPANGPATREQFVKSRPIINGTDRATDIAAIALQIQSALIAGGWS